MDVRYKTISGTVVGVVIANISLVLRLIARRIGRISLTADDYLMFVAVIFHWGIAIGGIIMLQNGLGLPLNPARPHQLVVFLQTQYAGAFLYTLTVAFTKLSILVMYRRVFDYQPIKSYVYFGFFLVILWAIVVCVAGALTCLPVEKVWNPKVAGSCINIPSYYYGTQIPNILTDAYIVVLPIDGISRLYLPRGQKISLMFIFGLAVLTVVFDVVRLAALINLDSSKEEMTLALGDTTIWTCVEPAIGIMAACFSNLRPLYRWVVNGDRRWVKRISIQVWFERASLVPQGIRRGTREKGSDASAREAPRLNLPEISNFRVSFPLSFGSQRQSGNFI